MIERLVALNACILLVFFSVTGQSPDRMSFQAVIRDGSGALVSNGPAGIKISVLQGSVSGTEVYSETHSEMTNTNGLITLEIGGGTVISGIYEDIDWGNGPYYLKREIDPLGGTNYVVSGTSQFLSVPYAIFAMKADTVLKVPDSSVTNEIQVLSISNDTIYLSDGGFAKLPATPTNTSELTNDSGFLTSELDGSTINELQTISKIDRAVTMSNNGGSFVDSVLTEAQVDAYTNNNGYLTSEVDGSITNEIQGLSVSKIGDTLYLSQSNYVIIPGLSDANPTPFVDFDGNVYDTIHIGTQVWMAENLKTTRYNDGTPIILLPDNTTWSNDTAGARVYYNNDSTQHDNVYGPLYNWYAVESGKLCPPNWHVPTDAEWTVLTSYLGGESVAGGKLKEEGTIHWESINFGATDEVGYSALPGGYRSDSGSFFEIRNSGVWWSKTTSSISNSWYRRINYDLAKVNSNNNNWNYGFSVRCLQD